MESRTGEIPGASWTDIMWNRNCAPEHHMVGHISLWQAGSLLICLTFFALVAVWRYQPTPPDVAPNRPVAPLTVTGHSTSQVQDDWSCSKIQVLAGDRLVVASLDKHAGMHEVQIQCINGGQWNYSVPPESYKCVHSSPIDRGAISRCEAENSPPAQVTANDIYRMASKDFGTADSRAPDSPALPRAFRLPHFITDQSSSQGTNPRGQRCVDQFVQCHAIAESPRTQVYLAEDVFVPKPIISHLAEVAQQCIENSAAAFPAEIEDIDQDGHLSIVVGELSTGKPASEPPLLGCVRAEDFLDDTPLGGDIIYLDYRLLYRQDMVDVLVHEMAHAAVFCRIRTLGKQGVRVSDIPPWLNEAIAHSCEYQRRPGSPNLSARISGYLNNPGRWPLIPPRQSAWGVSARGPVRAAGLFFVESQLGDQSLRELLDQTLLQDEHPVQPTGQSFVRLFREWTIWMSKQQTHGALRLRVRPLPVDGTTAPLAVRGTAATWWEASSAGTYSISAREECRLQVTLIRRNGEQVISIK